MRLSVTCVDIRLWFNKHKNKRRLDESKPQPQSFKKQRQWGKMTRKKRHVARDHMSNRGKPTAL